MHYDELFGTRVLNLKDFSLSKETIVASVLREATYLGYTDEKKDEWIALAKSLSKNGGAKNNNAKSIWSIKINW